MTTNTQPQSANGVITLCSTLPGKVGQALGGVDQSALWSDKLNTSDYKKLVNHLIGVGREIAEPRGVSSPTS